MDKTEYVLEMKDLSKSFGKNHVLRNISLKVRPGTVMGLMGENGAGKTSTIKALLNIINRDSGEIKIFGLENKENER